MSGLIGSIYSTTNSLMANQKAIEIAGKNMANVNNPSYSRQRVEFGISGGVSKSVVTRIRNALIDEKLIHEGSVTGNLKAQNEIYQQLEVILGEKFKGNVTGTDTLNGSTGNDSSTGILSTSINQFFNALHALSTNPLDASAKAVVIAKGDQLTTELNKIATELEQLDEDVVNNVENDIVKTNGLLKEIAGINKEIARQEIISPNSAHDLKDLRHQKLKELSNYINFDTTEVANGQIIITTQDKGNSSGPRDIVLVDRAVVENQLGFSEATNEVYFTNYTQPRPLTTSPTETAADFSGGSISGYLQTRATTDPFGAATTQAVGPLAKMREDLDRLAREIATQFTNAYDDNAAQEHFFDDDANPDPIDLNNVTAKNIRLYKGDPTNAFGGGIIPALSSANLKTTDTTNAGANELVMQMAELSDFKSSNLNGNNFIGFVSEIATEIGNELSNNSELLDYQTLISSQLEEQRASVSGVSVDEELANMIRYQKSFEASARVLSVMNELLDTIVNGLIR